MKIEGMAIDEIRAIPLEEMDALLALGRPITFNAGTASILAQFEIDGARLEVNLAHIDGGGEGVLVVLWKLITSYAKSKGMQEVRWFVHALTCAKPNSRLRSFLDSRGFVAIDHPRHRAVLTFTQPLLPASSSLQDMSGQDG